MHGFQTKILLPSKNQTCRRGAVRSFLFLRGMRMKAIVFCCLLLAWQLFSDKKIFAQSVAYYSNADSIVFVQWPNFNDPFRYNVIRLHDGGSRIDQADSLAPGLIYMTDNIPGRVYALKYNYPGTWATWVSADTGNSWNALATNPNHSGEWTNGRPGRHPGEAILEGDQYPPWLYCTSDSWQSYDSVQVNLNFQGDTIPLSFGMISYECGIVYSLRGDGHTYCISSDTGRTWTSGTYLRHERWNSLSVGAPDEIWGQYGREIFVAQDTGRTVRDSVLVYHLPNDFDPFAKLVPTDRPGEAYIVCERDDWTNQDLVIFRIQDYGARVDSFCYHLHHYRLPANSERNNLTTQSFQLMAYPNPFNSHVFLTWKFNAHLPVSVWIFDLLGREIWNWQGMQNGAYWDGRTATGISVASGRYWVRVSAAAREQVIPVLLVR
jgi:hypothetical protein